MSKHTPGDWYVETDERYGPDHAYIRTGEGRDGVLICTMNREVRHRLTRPNDIASDAALIAAAPDLLDALQGLVAAFDADLHDLMIAKLAAKAAITRATGGGK